MMFIVMVILSTIFHYFIRNYNSLSVCVQFTSNVMFGSSDKTVTLCCRNCGRCLTGYTRAHFWELCGLSRWSLRIQSSGYVCTNMPVDIHTWADIVISWTQLGKGWVVHSELTAVTRIFSLFDWSSCCNRHSLQWYQVTAILLNGWYILLLKNRN